MVSSPSRLCDHVQQHATQIGWDVFYTASVAFAGFVLALIVGVVAAFVAFRWGALREALRRVLLVAQVTPVLVFAPFITILLPLGPEAHIVVSFMVAVFPITTFLLDSLLRLPMALTDLVSLWQLRYSTAVWRVYLPYVAPSIFAACRVSVSLALVGATVAEFTGSRLGLGKAVFAASIRIDPEQMVVASLALVILGALFVKAVTLLERWIVRWSAT